jgi:hypothetical protein
MQARPGTLFRRPRAVNQRSRVYQRVVEIEDEKLLAGPERVDELLGRQSGPAPRQPLVQAHQASVRVTGVGPDLDVERFRLLSDLALVARVLTGGCNAQYLLSTRREDGRARPTSNGLTFSAA